jgi:glucosamine kinase
MRAAWNFESLPAHLHYAIGVDGGGTSTRARVVHRDGMVVGVGKAGASGLMQGTAQAWRHIGQAIALAVQGRLHAGLSVPTPANCALGLGLAGANNADWAAECIAASPGYARLALESDAVTALLGAHGGAPGAMAIMGTGAIGLALQANGERTTAGGWGFPCGDEGSGANLGLQAINLTQRAVDGRHAHTPLTRDLYQTVGGTPAALLAWCGAVRQFEYASLAPKVFAHATRDAEAARLLERAVQSLETLIMAVDPAFALPLVIAGGIAERLLPQLSPSIAQRVVPTRGDAMDGALTLCFQ